MLKTLASLRTRAKSKTTAQSPALVSPALPTFSWEAGYRIVTDPATAEQQEAPLTLFDILYPAEADIGAVFMAQGPLHGRGLSHECRRFCADAHYKRPE